MLQRVKSLCTNYVGYIKKFRNSLSRNDFWTESVFIRQRAFLISFVDDPTNGNSKSWVFRVFPYFRIAVPALPALRGPLARQKPRKP